MANKISFEMVITGENAHNVASFERWVHGSYPYDYPKNLKPKYPILLSRTDVTFSHGHTHRPGLSKGFCTHLEGTCDNSVASSMLKPYPGIKPTNMEILTLQELCARLNVHAEVYSRDIANNFEEHVIVDHYGVVRVEDTSPADPNVKQEFMPTNKIVEDYFYEDYF